MILPWESSESSTEVTTTDNNSIQAILETQRTKIWIVMTMPNLWQPYFFFYSGTCVTQKMTIYEEANFKQSNIATHTQIFIYIYKLDALHPTPRPNQPGQIVRPCSVWWIAILWISFQASWNHPTPSRMRLPSSLGDTQNWEKLKLFREGFAQECYTVVDAVYYEWQTDFLVVCG